MTNINLMLAARRSEEKKAKAGEALSKDVLYSTCSGMCLKGGTKA